MSNETEIGYKISARIVEIKGHCAAGHITGQEFEVDCFNAGGLCGFFYNSIYPYLMTFQFGGSLPWWSKDTITLTCPDPENLMTLELKRTPR